MQKLVWQNANGDTLDLTSGSYGITEWEGFSNSSLNIQSQQVPFQDGAVFLDALIEPRELSVTLKMQDNNDLELRYQLRRELIHKLNPKLGEGYLIYTNDFISKRIKCVAQIPLFETHNSNDSGTPKASLSWTACEPYWEDLQETVVSISGLNTIQNDGDVSAQVEIIIPAGSTNPAIANRRNQKQIKLLGSYDDTVEINTNIGQKYAKSEVLDFTWVSGGTFYGVAFGNGKYVYVGTQSVVEDYLSGKIVSVDSGNNVRFNDVIFADGQFIAVGDSGVIITSPDGINWTTRTSGTSNNLQGITYGNGLFVVVGASGNILTSSDGITWTSRTSGTSAQIRKIIWVNNLFITVGNSGIVLSSSNGISWTQKSQIKVGNLAKIAYDIVYNNGLYVVACEEGRIAISSDLELWSFPITNLNSSNILYSITYGNNLFIAVGVEAITGNSIIITSIDGENWNRETSNFKISLNCINYIKSNFIIVGDKGSIIIRDNNANIKFKTGITKQLNDVVYGDKQFIAVGVQGIILTSLDGINWSEQNSGVDKELLIITYGNELFVAIGRSGIVIKSFNGIDWSSSYGIYSGVLYNRIIYNNELFVLVGDKDNFGSNAYIYTSPDGINWSEQNSNISENLYGIIYGKSLFIAVGSNGTIITSPNGIDWSVKTSGTNENLNDIAYGKETFIVIGDNGIILTSLDGIDWSEQNSGVDDNLQSIVYKNEMFVIVGSNGTIITSPNGIDWSEQNIGVYEDLYNLTFGEKKYLIVGNNNTILNSYISETLNLISDLTPDSDMTFNLEIGNNDILYSDDNDYGAILKYRQKYIGV